MLRKIIYATLIVILTMEAASAQTDAPPNIKGVSRYSPMRTQQERNKDREIDRAYQSTIKGRPDAEKRLIPGAMSAQIHQRQPKTNGNECLLLTASRRRGLSRNSPACFVG